MFTSTAIYTLGSLTPVLTLTESSIAFVLTPLTAVDSTAFDRAVK